MGFFATLFFLQYFFSIRVPLWFLSKVLKLIRIIQQNFFSRCHKIWESRREKKSTYILRGGKFSRVARLSWASKLFCRIFSELFWGQELWPESTLKGRICGKWDLQKNEYMQKIWQYSHTMTHHKSDLVNFIKYFFFWNRI